MSTLTDHNLVCPDTGDYGAIALLMQADATALDTALDGISDAFDTHYREPYFLAITTAPISASSLSEQNIGIFNWAVAFTNMSVSTAAAFGIRMNIGTTGWYQFGGYSNLQAVGAVTALSRRTLTCEASLVVSGLLTSLDRVVWRTADTNTGGEFLVAGGGQFYALAGQTVDINLYFSHTNAASNVQANAPSRLWARFMGSGVEIGSA